MNRDAVPAGTGAGKSSTGETIETIFEAVTSAVTRRQTVQLILPWVVFHRGILSTGRNPSPSTFLLGTRGADDAIYYLSVFVAMAREADRTGVRLRE